MTPDQPQGKKRSRKIYVLWAIALTLLLTVGLFCWLVVVPVWRTDKALRALVFPTAFDSPQGVFPFPKWYIPSPNSEGFVPKTSGRKLLPEEAVNELGGKKEAAAALRQYLSMPDFAATRKGKAKLLLLFADAEELNKIKAAQEKKSEPSLPPPPPQSSPQSPP